MGEAEMWRAVEARDSSADGKFVIAVRTTGIYCRPSCPSRHPKRENIEFLQSPEAAEAAGYRACLRCKPRDVNAPQITWVKRVCDYIRRHSEEKITLDGKTKIAVYREGIFRVESGTTGCTVGKTATIEAKNEFTDGAATDAENGIVFGHFLETGSDGQFVLMELGR